MTNLEGRVIRRRRVVPPPVGVRSELEVWRDLAERLGSPVRIETEPAAVFDELARASAGGVADYSGIDHARLDAGEAIHWPCPASEGEPHPGTPRPFADGFPTPDGRARLLPVTHRAPSDDRRPGAPVRLLTGRVLAHYQSGAQTRRVAELTEASPDPFVEIHPTHAAEIGVAEGDLVRLTGAHGSAVAAARLTDRVRVDEVFMAFHWSGAGQANRLVGDAVDPISSMPELKLAAVRVERAELPVDGGRA